MDEIEFAFLAAEILGWVVVAAVATVPLWVAIAVAAARWREGRQRGRPPEFIRRALERRADLR